MAKWKDTEKWGRGAARERYGKPVSSGNLGGSIEVQRPQSPEDKQGKKYDNDASGWVRGAGEKAETKPGFDKKRR